MTKKQFEQLIKEVVKKEIKLEVKKYVNAYLPLAMNEIVEELVENKLNEGFLNGRELSINPINESVDEWPTLKGRTLTSSDVAPTGKLPFNRDKLKEMLGYGDMVVPGKSSMNLLTKAVTDGGVEIPISPEQIPEPVVKAMNTNYSDFLAKMNRRKAV